MQHRFSLSKTLLITVKNKKKESKPMIKGKPVTEIRPRKEHPQKKYVRYAALAGLTRMTVEEIY